MAGSMELANILRSSVLTVKWLLAHYEKPSSCLVGFYFSDQRFNFILV
jgi:hypothetical protein